MAALALTRSYVWGYVNAERTPDGAWFVHVATLDWRFAERAAAALAKRLDKADSSIMAAPNPEASARALIDRFLR